MFNNGHRSFLKEGSGDTCMYFSPDGNRCGVGCFLPEWSHEDISARRNDNHVNEILYMINPLTRELLMDEMPLDAYGLAGLQKAHDKCPDDRDVREVLCAWIDKNVVED